MRKSHTIGGVRTFLLAAIVIAVFGIAGCSKAPSISAAQSPAEQAAPAGPTGEPRLGQVSGTAASGSIVVLEPTPPREFPAPDTPVMDQVSLTFTPDMLFVRTGHAVDFRNSDDTLHNVHVGNSETKEPSFNVAIPTGAAYQYTFTKDGFYHASCDIHPAMSAEIISVSTPFAAVAGGDGRFAFADVPPGTYVVRAIVSGVNTERAVEVAAGVNTVSGFD